MSTEAKDLRLTDAMRSIQRRLGIRTQGEMAREMQMKESTYKLRLRYPGRMTLSEQRRLRVLGQRAHMDLDNLWREVI